MNFQEDTVFEVPLVSKYRTCDLSGSVRVAGVVAVAVVATGLLSTGAAHADVFVPLPDGQKTGPGVSIARTGERALISPSLAANGAGPASQQFNVRK